jgi:hypothetical protein
LRRLPESCHFERHRQQPQYGVQVRRKPRRENTFLIFFVSLLLLSVPLALAADNLRCSGLSMACSIIGFVQSITEARPAVNASLNTIFF